MGDARGKFDTPCGREDSRAFGPKVLKVLRFDSGLWPLRVVVSPKGREAARVQKVQRVQRVQRGWYRRFAAMSFICRFAAVGVFKIIEGRLL